jgi:hypothetical protein
MFVPSALRLSLLYFVVQTANGSFQDCQRSRDKTKNLATTAVSIYIIICLQKLSGRVKNLDQPCVTKDEYSPYFPETSDFGWFAAN